RPDEPLHDEAREDLAERCAAARNAEMEARLEVRTAEERLRAIGGRADSLSATAAAERTTRQRAAERRRRQAEQAAVARAVALGARYAVEAAEQSVNQALARRAAAERRAADAQKQLDRLGKVNPLALEEYEALTERHNFLATQLEDLRKTRRDLLTVVKEVDDRVQEVFASAYADTAREFEHL